MAPLPLDEQALLYFPRMGAALSMQRDGFLLKILINFDHFALVFVSFAAVFSLSVNTRLGILTSTYQNFNKDLLAKKTILATTLDQRDRKYMKRTLRVLLFGIGNQAVHIKCVVVVVGGPFMELFISSTIPGLCKAPLLEYCSALHFGHYLPCALV